MVELVQFDRVQATRNIPTIDRVIAQGTEGTVTVTPDPDVVGVRVRFDGDTVAFRVVAKSSVARIGHVPEVDEADAAPGS